MVTISDNVMYWHLPIPAPEETVYSVLSRALYCNGRPYGKTLKELTRTRQATSLFSVFPPIIFHISEQVHPHHPWSSIECILKNHTTLPYFIYFSPPEYRSHIFNNCNSLKFIEDLHKTLGLTVYPYRASPSCPQFCTLCLIEDLNQVGFSFYHREHQLPGVNTCWKHRCTLYNGCQICGPYPIKRCPLLPPGICNCVGGISPLAVQEVTSLTEPLFWLTKESTHLLDLPTPNNGNTYSALKSAAISQGFMQGAHLDYKMLSLALEKRFGRNTLDQLNIPTAQNGRFEKWLARKFQLSRHSRRQPHTIHTLLFIAVFFKSVMDFISILESEPAQTISFLKKQPDDKTARVSLQSILELRDNSTLGISGIASALNTTPNIIIRKIKQVKTHFPLREGTLRRVGTSNLRDISNALKAGDSKQEIAFRHKCGEWIISLIELDNPKLSALRKAAKRSRLVHKHRQNLYNLQKNEPALTRSKLHSKHYAVYDYLNKHDTDWFNKRLPPTNCKQKNTNRTERKNWKIIDQNAARTIRKHLLEEHQHTKPKWRTQTGLLIVAGILSQYHANPKRFPSVKRLLEKICESRDVFTERKLSWAITEMKRQGIGLSINQLRRVAGLTAKDVREKSDFISEFARMVNCEMAEGAFFSTQIQSQKLTRQENQVID